MEKISNKKKTLSFKILLLFIIIGIIGFFIFVYIQLDKKIPNNIRLTLNEDEEFNFDLPFEGKFNASKDVLNINNDNVPAGEIKLDLREPFTLKATEFGNYKINLKLFGFLDFKDIDVDVIESTKLIPAGDTIGIYMQTDGVMVLGTGVIKAEDGLNYEPALNKLKTGDYITAINNKKISTKEELINEIAGSDGKALDFQVRRNGGQISYRISPVKSISGEYKIGTWIRDDTQGIGTLTFITANGEFAALGHGIADIDTSQIVEVEQGSIYNAEVMTIVKGKEGEPGELIGVINQTEENRIGIINKNTAQGVYGQVSDKYKNDNKALPIGLKQDISIGPASIICCVDNELCEYEIMIEKVTLGGSKSNKGIILKITDSKLLESTGGIVQGMSGSPIIQDGKIIGAVTHVFIQDSTKGYGAFIENMIFNIE
ncbi:MAG TPA: SpoIVB peptidase [Clostridiales bacterium]|nr:SpoIVB peptidase [Clostridiales bacterium]